MRNLVILWALTLACSGLNAARAEAAGPAAPAAPTVTSAHVRLQLLAERTRLAAGEPLTLAIVLDMDQPWHTYWVNPGEAGMPTRVVWELPEGFAAGPLQWPAPRVFVSGGIVGFGYHGRAVLLTTVTPPAQLGQEAVTIKAKVSFLACDQECVPGQAQLELTLPVGDKAAAGGAAPDALFAAARAALPVAIPAGAAQARQAAGAIVLTVDLSKLPPAARAAAGARFLAEQGDLFDEQAEQKCSRSGEQLRLTLPLAATAKALPARLTGVLLLAEKEPADKAVEKVPLPAVVIAVPLGVVEQ